MGLRQTELAMLALGRPRSIGDVVIAPHDFHEHVRLRLIDRWSTAGGPVGEDSTVAVSPSDREAARRKDAEPFEEAFALGWRVAYLYHLYDLQRPTAALDSGLADASGLGKKQEAEMVLAQINGGLNKIPAAEWPKGMAPETGGIVPKDEAVPKQPISDLHEEILTELMLLDFRRGKAYAVGSQLGQTVLNPSAVANTRDATRKAMVAVFASGRVAHLTQQLRDLKTNFQFYAVDAVAATLADWAKWTTKNESREVIWEELARSLYRQGQVWRALLSGEKQPTDTLQVPDYLEAGTHIVSQFRRLAWATAGRIWGALIIVGVVAAVAVLAFFALGRSFQAAFLSGVGAALAALGITGASVRAAAGKAVSGIGDELWDAELAASVAQATYLGPLPVDDSSVVELRKRSVAGRRPPPKPKRKWF